MTTATTQGEGRSANPSPADSSPAAGSPNRVTATSPLVKRRIDTIGPYSPLFYRKPLEIVSAQGVWMVDSKHRRYLDAYNNVPHVGHSNPRVREAVTKALSEVNVNSRYITRKPIEYAERLLSFFPDELDRMFFVNSGSEANELALRIASQSTHHTGVLISDFSYHGNTTALARLTTGLEVAEDFAPYARAIRIPDVPQCSSDGQADEIVAQALRSVDEAIASLNDEGYGVSCLLIDPSFSTEGMPYPSAAYIQGLVERVHAAGGLYIADEVQSGFGRMGSTMWGFEQYAPEPDLVTMGKPMGNGLPIGAVVLPNGRLEEFASRNQYFNTFATSAVPCAAASAVLDEMRDNDLRTQSFEVGTRLNAALAQLQDRHQCIRSVRGSGLYIAVEVSDDSDAPGDFAGRICEHMKDHGVLHGRVGRLDNVLKVRPPLVFTDEHAALLVAALDQVLDEVEG
ncbi:aminotransferase class III-fold pyridoxal phosphate-dependent enzyme [Bifidobacterium tibiigranuli]|uniref:Aminotransferase class III-fold pyridoxal phosphate-dependent enzyme n=2 Tax=Bifidobacterium TaxID=1678 RepID=A0A5N6S1T8_9BIFI|nr:aspartate aminotransferase family protein [Bifidobacterium tibiigranuli]KAE8129809.1 aminotransferase class III-fold pyridoxal phosphate-dependent enzyme [Bifidobacterium tibiigranuli]